MACVTAYCSIRYTFKPDLKCTMTTTTTTEVAVHSPPPVNEKGCAPAGPRILLGVTGSVAAIKVPEVVVQLVTQCNAEVKVVLSRGGKTFWDKAADYDPVSWGRLCELLQQGNVDENGNGIRAVEIHGTLRSLCASSDVSGSRRYETIVSLILTLSFWSLPKTPTKNGRTGIVLVTPSCTLNCVIGPTCWYSCPCRPTVSPRWHTDWQTTRFPV
jgi:hypothetical protein